MRGVHREFPDDPDVCTLLADALMSRTPWKLWDLETGEPRAGASTGEVRNVLERAITAREAAGRPAHAGMLHYYIHLMEMSPTPEAALRAGDELFALARDCGHLHHMPTHVDFQCGRYHEVVSRNSAAIARNRKYFERYGALNLYSYARIHDIHFKLYGALFLGHYRAAMEAVAEFDEPRSRRRSSGSRARQWRTCWRATMGSSSTPSSASGAGGRSSPSRCPRTRISTSSPPRSRTMRRPRAHAALGEVATAEREKERFDGRRGAKVPRTRTLFNNVWLDVFEIALEMLDGEVEYRKGRHDIAFEHLRRAIRLEDSLPYDEPWGWMQPVRHALGALLLEQGRVARGGGRLSRGPGVRRAHHPGAAPSRQRLEPARSATSASGVRENTTRRA